MSPRRRFFICLIRIFNSMAEEFKNPIDKDKITETPSTLEYGHHVGSAVVKPEDRGKLKGRSLSAMEHQTDMQLNQIYEQMQLLADQAKLLSDRKAISEVIYGAEIRFQPIINHVYHVYEKDDHSFVLSMIAKNEWGRSSMSIEFVATVRLLADHTWDILEKNEGFEF